MRFSLFCLFSSAKIRQSWTKSTSCKKKLVESLALAQVLRPPPGAWFCLLSVLAQVLRLGPGGGFCFLSLSVFFHTDVFRFCMWDRFWMETRSKSKRKLENQLKERVGVESDVLLKSGEKTGKAMMKSMKKKNWKKWIKRKR